MNSSVSLSDVLNGGWTINDESIAVAAEEIHPAADNDEDSEMSDLSQNSNVENDYDGKTKETHSEIDVEALRKTAKVDEKIQESTNSTCKAASNDSNVLISPPYYDTSIKPEATLQHDQYSSGYSHGFSISSTYHQPFVSMVRQKKASAIATALQKPVFVQPTTPVPVAFIPGYSFSFGSQYILPNETDTGAIQYKFHESLSTKSSDSKSSISKSAEKHTTPSTALPSDECGERSSSYVPQRFIPCFDLTTDVLGGVGDENSYHLRQKLHQDERRFHENETMSNSGDRDADVSEDGIGRHETEEKLANSGDTAEVEEEEKGEEEEEIVIADVGEIGDAMTAAVNDKEDVESATSSSCGTKHQKSQLEKLLMQPVKKPVYQEFQQPFIVTFSAIGNQPQPSSQNSHLPKTMQFYQPPAQQHLARSTPPPGFVPPYGMGMRPHEEETRQIMNLDSQQTHNSSPSSSWNQPYGQMTNLNAYQRGPNIYAAPVPPSMVHQNGPPGVVPTSNPYYPTPGPPPPHHHIQPQAPMMPPGMHGQQQQQQPYYNTQSPLTGSSPSMNYGTNQIPAPPPTSNGSAPIFNFSKPRNSNEGSSVNGGGHRRKKHNDLSSPRYNNNSNEDVDGSIFPDMADFPLLDVVQSKAKKDAGRKPCRPHLCEQSRMLISRVCHFHREFVKRLPSRHPLANSPFSKPDQWTSQIMGISLATVRKCIDMAVDEEVFTRCTDKNLVNLTPSERAEREELLSKLSTVFEDEKTLGAGTAGMTIAEYSPRRSYSNTLIRQSTDDKSSNSSFANGADYGSSETTLLNLDDHSNHSKDFGATPTPTTELSNGGHMFEDLRPIGGGNVETEEKSTPIMDTPKRGRPRKAPGTVSTKSTKRKESVEDSEMSEDRDEHEKKTEDEDETNEETEKKSDELEQVVLAAEREDDAASSEGTNRSETATPEPADTSVAKKTRAAARRKNTRTVDEELQASTKRKRGSVTSATAGVTQFDDENADHKMVTRARSRQP